MAKQTIVVPGVYRFRGHPHAVWAGETLYIGARVAADVHGNVVGRGDLLAQVDKVFQDTEAVLKAAGLSFENAMKLHLYTPGMEGNFTSMLDIRSKYLIDVRWSGTGVDCAIVDTDWLYQIAVMTGESKETVVTPEVICIPDYPRFPRTSRNAHASRVGHVFHVQGQVPWDLQGNTVGGDDITAQAEQSYQVLDSIVRATGSTWDDVAEVTDILKHPRDHDAVSGVRGRYVKPGQYAASALLARLVSEKILLEPELIVATETKDVVVSPGVYRRDGGAHAVRVGRTLYLSGQVALDGDGRLVGKGDVETQTRQVLANIEAVLEATGGSMDDVVRLDTFLARRADHSKVIAVREEVLPVGEMVVSDVVTGWLDPDVLVHMRCIAALQ